MNNILIIDNDVHVCETIASLVIRQKHQCTAAHTIASGLELLQSVKFDLVFLDVSLPDGNGLTFLTRIKESVGQPEVIILTGKSDVHGAEQAIQDGAWDFLVKPTSIEQITLSMKQALNFHHYKKDQLTSDPLNLDRIIGESPQMRTCYELVADAARSDANILINGETGTGKELFARTIHDNSARASREFVVVDCASLTETLIESTLFGYVKGAFTGAQTDKKGLIPLADKGTLFLDEIGELPISVQKSLLRVLQERSYRPVGESREYTSDFRLIAATNRDLKIMAAEGDFRQDLLYRIHTIQFCLPPLRRRTGDIRELTKFKLQQLSEQYQLEAKAVNSDFYEVLNNYDWPGNVRQLFNVIERAFIAAGNSETIYLMHLPPDLRVSMARSNLEKKEQPAPAEDAPQQGSTARAQDAELAMDTLPTLKVFKDETEKKYLEELTKRYLDNTHECLKISGLSRSHFYALLKKHNIQP
ncbi:sigma-54-dependent transcriptional regulator [Desulfotalea psychrophila]|nr:sigma-54 dependent transcriptional regulator [Desulfotalea psychrophila]